MNRTWLPLAAALVLLAGCDDHTAPRDTTPPAAPRGVRSVTGDGQATLSWLANTESDVIGYRVYEAPCAGGPACPYDRVGSTTGTRFTVTGLANGVTRYFAVSAVDRSGNESALAPLSPEYIFDTPRPEGSQALTNAQTAPATSGYDFSAYSVRDKDDPSTDVYFTSSGGLAEMICPFVDTDIQDAGYASSLDAVDFAPSAGWSPTGTVELIVGHCYVVWTYDNHYAKFRVTGLGGGQVVFDWAYQTDPGNPELRARPAPREGARVRRPLALGG